MKGIQISRTYYLIESFDSEIKDVSN